MGTASEPSITVRPASPRDRTTAMTLIVPGSARAQMSLTLLRTGQGLLWVAVERQTDGQTDGQTQGQRERPIENGGGSADNGPAEHAKEPEQLVGLLLATVQVDPDEERLVGYIQELLVHPAYRRLGVAMHLLDAAERYFLDEHAFDRIELATSPENDAAIRLYRSRGYVIHQVRICKNRT